MGHGSAELIFSSSWTISCLFLAAERLHQGRNVGFRRYGCKIWYQRDDINSQEAYPPGSNVDDDDETPVKKEEQQGADLTRAAVEAGASHIIFTSTERGGQDQSENDPTDVPHFASKYRTEQAIKSAVAASNGQLTYTFLRPVAFFENMPNGFLGRAFVSMWRLNGPDRKLQMISSKDVGKVAADAFLNASSDEYRNKSISLAGDSLTPTDAARIFKDETGLAIPATYAWLGWTIRTLVSDLRHMFQWFKVVGFGTDVSALRKRYPSLMDFRTWLREESDWSKNKTA